MMSVPFMQTKERYMTHQPTRFYSRLNSSTDGIQGTLAPVHDHVEILTFTVLGTVIYDGLHLEK